MTTIPRRSTVIGVFEDRAHAVAAIKDLYQAGFVDNQIGIAGRNSEESAVTETPATADQSSTAPSSAATGAVAGASLGGLIGLGITVGMIPVVGPVIAGGTLAIILANTAGGAAIGGVFGAVTGEGLRDVDTEYYEREFAAGRMIVTVSAGNRGDEVLAIFHRNGGYDLDTEATRPTVTTATGDTTVHAATATGLASNPYPHAPGEIPAYQPHNVNIDRS